MKLWSRLERKRRPQSETRGGAEPARAILESGAFATALQVVTQRADLDTIAQHHADTPLHDCGTRAFFMRTRLGKRSSSSRRPVSSRLTSIRAPRGSPKPKTKSAIAYTPRPTLGSPFSARRKVFLATPMRSATARTVSPRL